MSFLGFPINDHFCTALQNIFKYAVKGTYFVLAVLDIRYNLKHNVNIAEMFPIHILFSVSLSVVYFRVNLKGLRQMICLKMRKEDIRGPNSHTECHIRRKEYTMKSCYLQSTYDLTCRLFSVIRLEVPRPY